jgi:hypothetical protein
MAARPNLIAWPRLNFDALGAFSFDQLGEFCGSLWGGKAHRTMLLSGIEFLADEGMYHIVLQFSPEAQQCQKVSLSHKGWPKWVNTVLLWLGTPTALILSALAG